MLDYQKLKEIAEQRAKVMCDLMYPAGDPRRNKKEEELKNKYYAEYLYHYRFTWGK